MFQRNRVSVFLLLATILANCGQTLGATPKGDEVTPVFAFSEAVVGRNRIAIGLVRSGTPLNDPAAKVHLRFFNLDENNPQPKAETDATCSTYLIARNCWLSSSTKSAAVAPSVPGTSAKAGSWASWRSAIS